MSATQRKILAEFTRAMLGRAPNAYERALLAHADKGRLVVRAGRRRPVTPPPVVCERGAK